MDIKDEVDIVEEETAQEPGRRHCSRSSWFSPGQWIRWKPTSTMNLVEVERKILNCLKSVYDTKFVKLPQSQHRIWTVSVNANKERMPIVCVHGMGGGIGLWAQNIDALAKKRPLYAFDLLGFGRSSRPAFSTNAQLAEMEFVESIEEWRQEMKLNKMVLLGHSLGAYVASSYALKYPQRIQHLILVDPWGFPERPKDDERARRIPAWVRAIAFVASPFNPLAIVRAAGPLGPGLIRRFRPDLQKKFSHLFDDDTILEYIYHCNAQTPSGEAAFKAMTQSFGWAKRPMIERIADIKKELPITFIYGSRSWMDTGSGYQSKYLRNDSYVDVQVIRGAGHHVYADKAEPFNELVTKILDKVDEDLSQGRPPHLEEHEKEVTSPDHEPVPITEF